jgi:hypothetical protein
VCAGVGTKGGVMKAPLLLISAMLLTACAPMRRVTAVPPPDPAHVCQTNPSYYDPGCCWKMRGGKCVEAR